jgi:hypothetical protein
MLFNIGIGFVVHTNWHLLLESTYIAPVTDHLFRAKVFKDLDGQVVNKVAQKRLLRFSDALQ